MSKILLLEDDQSFGYILSEYLGMQDFEVTWVKSAEAALEVLDQQSFHLAILDIMLPGLDGFGLAGELKRHHGELPFIFLSARSLKIDQLKGYRAGACDYITKPVDEELLVAKIRALLRPTASPGPSQQVFQIGKYRFMPHLFKLEIEGDEIKLTARESALLRMLCEHRNELLPRRQALQEIWGSNDEFTRKSMDVFISHLRKHLARDTSLEIANIHGQGFIFRA